MIVELGHFSLILAMMVSLIQVVVPLWGAGKGWNNWMKVSEVTALGQFFLVVFSFYVLIKSFVSSDFSVAIVAANSHTLKPLLYKITGVWGNHEGSMLLWILILTLYGALVVWFGQKLPLALKARVLSVQALISFLFFGFLLFTSNPFERLLNPPLNGNGLNPILQDPGLAFHPPFLYLGYVGLSLTFSFAIAALISGQIDSAWARWVRPWALSAWIFLTLGIALGSWWAYYELGWGGWWFWDPVENASFMPWLACSALLHSALVVEKRNTLKGWTIFLAIVAFSFSLIGTFIVRSGILTSVHSFASDPSRGLYILVIIVAIIGGSFLLFCLRADKFKSSSFFSTFSRESSLVVNNLLFSCSAAVVFVGTIWPLIIETFSESKISVGEPFFDIAFTPFMVLLALILPVGASLGWKRGNLKQNKNFFIALLILTVSLGLLIWSLQTGSRILGPIGLGLAFWVVSGSLLDVFTKIRFFKFDVKYSLRRFKNLPRADFGKAISHIGFGFLIFGISSVTAWEKEDIRVLTLKESYSIANYTLTLEEVSSEFSKNYYSTTAFVKVNEDGNFFGYLLPEKRFYPVQELTTTEAAISSNLFRDLYVVLGDQQTDNSWVMRTYLKPFVIWIWLGAVVICIGGLLSLTDRRIRIEDPAKKSLNRVI